MNTLLRFTAQNYRSICNQHSIVLTPRNNITDQPKANIATNGNTKYLKTIVIYGANSSGKSNWVRAINQMCRMVRRSNKRDPGEPLPYEPFKLDETSSSAPTLFEAEFLIEEEHFRYGFSYDKTNIYSEWLCKILSSEKEQNLFLRDLDGIGVDATLFPEGIDKETLTTDNRLFMPLVAQMNGTISKSILGFFFGKINTLSGLDTDGLEEITKEMLKDQKPGVDKMKSFFLRTQLGFSDVAIRKSKFEGANYPADIPDEAKKLLDALNSNYIGEEVLRVESMHGIYDADGTLIEKKSFDFDDMESSGTQKLFQLSGPIFDTLEQGNILVIDELDAKMHPLLSQELVRLFNNPESNPLGAQLIFTTHDTNLLSAGLLRRDQIWFTEKDSQERTDLYCMMQLKLPDGTTPRRDGNIERNYIQGRYGAIPYIKPYND